MHFVESDQISIIDNPDLSFNDNIITTKEVICVIPVNYSNSYIVNEQDNIYDEMTQYLNEQEHEDISIFQYFAQNYIVNIFVCSLFAVSITFLTLLLRE